MTTQTPTTIPQVVANPAAAHAALSPLRRAILGELDEPRSAGEIGARIGLTRQKVNYHLTVLLRHGLVHVAETRQRRGFTERRFARASSVVLAPDVLGDDPTPRDDLSADAVIGAATDAIRAVGALSTAGRPHPTATLVTDVTFATPAAAHSFLAAVGDLAARYDTPGDGVEMRVSLLAHITEPETLEGTP